MCGLRDWRVHRVIYRSNFHTLFAVLQAVFRQLRVECWLPSAQLFLVYPRKHVTRHIPTENNLMVSNRTNKVASSQVHYVKLLVF